MENRGRLLAPVLCKWRGGVKHGSAYSLVLVKKKKGGLSGLEQCLFLLYTFLFFSLHTYEDSGGFFVMIVNVL